MPSTNPPGGVHIWLGPDRARKLARLEQLGRTLQIQPLDQHRADAATITAAELLALCRQQPAVSPVRLIVVDQANRLEAAVAEGLRQHAGAIQAVAYVILLTETEPLPRHAMTRLLEQFPHERFGTAPTPERPFALADSLAARDAAGALTALHDQLTGGREPTEVLGLIAWQLSRWLSAKRLLTQGTEAGQLAAILRLKPWQVERIHTELAHRSLEQLQRWIERCREVDLATKTGQAIPQLALEQLVTEVCLG